MDIFLAGGNGKAKIISEFFKGVEDGYLLSRRDKRKPISFVQEVHNRGGGQANSQNLFLAGEHPVKNGKIALKIARGETDMNLFLAGTLSRPYVIEQGKGFKILESFYYCRKNEVIPRLMPLLGDFLLDSGAFSFMSGKSSVKWDLFIEEYPPLGIALYMEGEHLCKTMRGVKKQGKMSCSYLTGVFRDASARAEFLSLVKEVK